MLGGEGGYNRQGLPIIGRLKCYFGKYFVFFTKKNVVNISINLRKAHTYIKILDFFLYYP